MDLYNFYRGLENVIDTLQKDRHDLTMKDYLSQIISSFIDKKIALHRTVNNLLLY